MRMRGTAPDSADVRDSCCVCRTRLRRVGDHSAGGQSPPGGNMPSPNRPDRLRDQRPAARPTRPAPRRSRPGRPSGPLPGVDRVRRFCTVRRSSRDTDTGSPSTPKINAPSLCGFRATGGCQSPDFVEMLVMRSGLVDRAELALVGRSVRTRRMVARWPRCGVVWCCRSPRSRWRSSVAPRRGWRNGVGGRADS